MRCELVHFIHTREFDERLADLPMTDEELRDAQWTLQSDPEAGDAIRGTDGVRKLRAAVKADDMKKVASIEERIIRSMSQTVEIARAPRRLRASTPYL